MGVVKELTAKMDRTRRLYGRYLLKTVLDMEMDFRSCANDMPFLGTSHNKTDA